MIDEIIFTLPTSFEGGKVKPLPFSLINITNIVTVKNQGMIMSMGLSKEDYTNQMM